jgi:hypothetical protein
MSAYNYIPLCGCQMLKLFSISLYLHISLFYISNFGLLKSLTCVVYSQFENMEKQKQ